MRFFIVLCVVLAAIPAAAQKANDDRARVHYDAGREHYDNGHYEAAIGEFEAAYAVSPKPELRYNLYLAHERLGHFEQALAHLEAYLAAATIEPAERARLEARRDALRVRATPPPVDDTAEPAATVSTSAEVQRHSGFVARLALGVGYARAETDAFRIAGGIGDLTLTAGWMLTDTLALHATIWGANMAGGSITSKDLGLTFDDDSRYAAGAIGLGGTLHLPSQFLLSLSLGAAGISQEAGGRKTESEIGGAALFLAGKEWSLSPSWTAGVALGFSFFSIPGKVQDTAVERDNPASVFMVSILGTIAFD